MKALIVGGGKTLLFICRNFISRGYEVAVVSEDRAECVRLARKLPVRATCGDAGDPAILKDAGAMDADVILSLTPNDQDNLMVCQLAALQFGPVRTLALANDPENVEVFEALGVSAFSPTQVVGALIEQRASLEQITNLFPVGEGRVIVTEISLQDDSPVAGKRLAEIELPENALVAVVLRGNEAIVPRGNNALRANDRLVLITLPENHGKVLKAIAGEDG